MIATPSPAPAAGTIAVPIGTTPVPSRFLVCISGLRALRKRIVLQILAALAPAWLVSALIFGPVAGVLARRVDRSPLVWLVYGAILGPIAVGLVVLAPPGRCPVCGTPTAGWSPRCIACGSDVRTGRSPTPPVQDRAGSSAPAPMPSAAGSPAIVGPRVAATRASDASGVVGARGAQPEGPVSSPGLLVGGRRPQTWPAVRQPEPGGVLSPYSQAAAPVPTSPPIRAAGADQASPATMAGNAATGSRMAAALRVGGHAPPTADVIASAAYLGGSDALTIGMRYGLARDGEALLVVGPLDQTPSTIRVVRAVDALDITAIDGRLLISERKDGAQGSFYLVFVLVAGGPLDEVESLLSDASTGPQVDATPPDHAAAAGSAPVDSFAAVDSLAPVDSLAAVDSLAEVDANAPVDWHKPTPEPEPVAPSTPIAEETRPKVRKARAARAAGGPGTPSPGASAPARERKRDSTTGKRAAPSNRRAAPPATPDAESAKPDVERHPTDVQPETRDDIDPVKPRRPAAHIRVLDGKQSTRRTRSVEPSAGGLEGDPKQAHRLPQGGEAGGTVVPLHPRVAHRRGR
jgi:hypothetical protein